MSGELWRAGWVFWTAAQTVCVGVAIFEWWLSGVEGRASMGSGSERRMVNAQWGLAAAHGRLQVMVLVWVCWLMTSGLAWICLEGV
jgi:hypothetical protein